jgi:hypothetical protein
MTDTPNQPTTDPALDASGWVELGKTIARKQAAGWGAEWKPHYWDDVTERERSFESAREKIEDLEWEERHALIDACRDAWSAELSALLRAKRGTRTIEQVSWCEVDGSNPVVHLQLAFHTTITGTLGNENKFTFRLSRSTEKTIALPADAEFATKPSDKKRFPRTDRLRLEHECSGFRHWLGRRDVHCGYGITLVLPDDTQVPGRYECNPSYEDCVPVFYFTLAGGTEGNQRLMRMPADAEYLIEGRAE